MVRLNTAQVQLIASVTKNHREMFALEFKKEHNLEITRWMHDYESLNGAHPKLGVVFLASDSVIDEALEAWALVGHNAQEIKDEKGK
jgi:hypothetical protein